MRQDILNSFFRFRPQTPRLRVLRVRKVFDFGFNSAVCYDASLKIPFAFFASFARGAF